MPDFVRHLFNASCPPRRVGHGVPTQMKNDTGPVHGFDQVGCEGHRPADIRGDSIASSPGS